MIDKPRARLCVLTGFVLALGIPVLSGCGLVDGGTVVTATAGTIIKDIFSRPDVNLTEKNNAAADYLVQQIHSFVSKTAPVAVQPLTLVGEEAITSELGSKITEGVGQRLQQLGYRVHLDETMAGAVRGTSMKDRKPSFILGGTYEIDGRDVPINLRMVRASDGRVVGAFDYTIPRTGELRAMAEHKATIYRISE